MPLDLDALTTAATVVTSTAATRPISAHQMNAGDEGIPVLANGLTSIGMLHVLARCHVIRVNHNTDEKDARGNVAGDEFQRHAELRAHSGAVYNVKFSSCGRLLASCLLILNHVVITFIISDTGSLDKTVCLWDVLGRKQVLLYEIKMNQVL